MKFTKMHGLGNDYIYLNCMERVPENMPGLAKRLSDRHFGVGGDGVICICPSDEADFKMRMFNADGSEGAMCGNGLRCAAQYAFERRIVGSWDLVIETGSGNRSAQILGNGLVRTDLGKPIIQEKREIYVKDKSYTGIEINVGNRHFVVRTEDPDKIKLDEVGPWIERHPCFADGVNVEFVQVLSRTALKLRVWERGSGETMACGTGACAAWAAAMDTGEVEDQGVVLLPGGELHIAVDGNSGHFWITGPAVTVFEGNLDERWIG